MMCHVFCKDVSLSNTVGAKTQQGVRRQKIEYDVLGMHYH